MPRGNFDSYVGYALKHCLRQMRKEGCPHEDAKEFTIATWEFFGTDEFLTLICRIE